MKKTKRLAKSMIAIVMTAAVVFGTISPSCSAASKEFKWLAKDGVAHIETGLGNGTGTEGLWYVADDHGDGGKSEVIWDHADPEDHGSTISDKDVQKLGGISGTARLVKGSLPYSPRVDICFDIVGLKEGGKETADVTDWGGLSISYECDIAPSLQLSMGENEDIKIGYAHPEFGLSKASAGEGVVKTISWSEFKQPGWVKGDCKIDIDTAVTKIATVKFHIESQYEGDYHFKITGIGSQNVKLPNPNEYTITYNLGGGTNAAGNPNTYNSDSETFTLADPIRSGYEFGGWYEDAEFKTAAKTTIEKGSSGDKTFYAKWLKPLTSKDITVGSIADLTYTGTPIKPDVLVKDGTKALLENTDYTVTYRQAGKIVTDPVEPGSYDVGIEGKGNYCGTRALTFTIKEKSKETTDKQTDPETTDPKVSDPEVTDPEVTDPEVTSDTPEVVKAEVAKKGTFELAADPVKKTYTATFLAVADKKKTEVVIGNTIKVKGKSYKITKVNKDTFKGSKATKVTIGKNIISLLPKSFQGSKVKVLIIKSKLLTKKTVKNAFKGSKAKSITIYIKVGSKKDNKKYASLYKKIFTKSNVGKKVTIKY